MNAQILLILGQDGITNGAIYALLALSILLVFTVTRVLFIPQGEFVAVGALMMGALQEGRPTTLVWLLLALALAEAAVELRRLIARARDAGGLRLPWVLPARVLYALSMVALLQGLPLSELPMAVHALLTLAVAVPLGPQMYRLFYQPLATASPLVLLIVSVAVHFAFVGIALLVFGPGGAKIAPISEAALQAGALNISSQTLWVFAVSLALIVALYLFFGRTLYGKALRATAINQTGARLMGISPAFAGRTAFLLAAFIGVLSGILIAPVTTLYYDSGFLISLKGFVGAIIGGLTSYPLAAIGALLVGLIEAFSAFWASTYKEVIVFTLIIPVLLWRSLTSRTVEDEHDDAPQADVRSAAHARIVDRGWLSPRLMLAVFIVVVAVGPVVLRPFYVTLLNYIGLYALVALGLVLLTGTGGLVSFGQAAFVGLGAYSVAALTAVAADPSMLDAAPPVLAAVANGLAAGGAWAALLLALVLTTVVALLLGALTLKLSGHYLPLGTIAWGISLYYLFGTADWLGGHTGITGMAPLRIFGWVLDQPAESYYLIWTVLVLAVLAVRSLLDSREGRAIHALRGGRVMAEAMGIDTARSRRVIFLVAALLACLSGWLYATMQRFVNPTPFGINIGIEYLFMAVVGGAGHVWGAVAGAGILTLLKQWLQDLLPRLLGQNGNFEMIVFGVMMVWLLQRAPQGVWPMLIRHLPLKRTAHAAVTEAAPLARRERAETGAALLEARNLTRRFGGLTANDDVSLTVRAGEILALIGPNGAGKTTLFNLLSGVDTADAGEVLLLGQDVTRSGARHIARMGMSRTFQHVRLLPALSVLENVALGAHLRGREGVVRSALRLDRAEEATLLAEAARQSKRAGLGDSLERDAGSLALGQQRILEVARALCADPCVLLLDEPAAGLRHREKEALADLLRRLRGEGLGILLVEHDMDFVMGLVDRVVVMEFGRQIAEGLPETVRADPRVLEAYLGAVVDPAPAG